MPLFNVVVHGRGLWISIDDEAQRIAFRVARVVDATDAARAAEQALELVRTDRKARPLPGYGPQPLLVDTVAFADALPDPQPGVAFFPDPE